MSPDDAFDLLTDQCALEQWAAEQGLGLREARNALAPLADGASSDSKALRCARAAHAKRGRLAAGRTDVEELCAFVERAVGLPVRLREVFGLCIVNGLSHRECADRMGIAPATVRVHLRRLRKIMRARGGSARELPGVWSRNPG